MIKSCINRIIFSGTTKQVINDRNYRFGLFMVFTVTFKTMSVISLRSVLLVEETRVPGETTDLSQATDITLSHNVVSSTPHHAVRTHNISDLLITQVVVSPTTMRSQPQLPLIEMKKLKKWR